MHSIAEDQPQAGAVWERLVDVFVESAGVDPRDVVPEAGIVSDLGID